MSLPVVAGLRGHNKSSTTTKVPTTKDSAELLLERSVLLGATLQKFLVEVAGGVVTSLPPDAADR